jgi:hypothetical protein
MRQGTAAAICRGLPQVCGSDADIQGERHPGSADSCFVSQLFFREFPFAAAARPGLARRMLRLIETGSRNNRRRRPMFNLMTQQRLRRENRDFRGTGGLSQDNRAAGFIPAFCDMETGRTELSRLADGMLAPIHLLCGLPAEWVVSRDTAGAVSAVKPSIVAGFVPALRARAVGMR